MNLGVNGGYDDYDYTAGEDGWAHSLQIHPDGSADYVAHRTEHLHRATRWLYRTPDQQALALVEPGTAEPEGYLTEKAKGNIKILPPNGRFECCVIVGTLAGEQARPLEQMVNQVMHR